MSSKSFKSFVLEDAEEIDEVLSQSDPASKWIHDFVKSDNPKFKGKTKKERIKMALGAYYAKQRNEEVESIDEISQQTKASYTAKAKAQVKELKPFTQKKSEYHDLAKNLIAKRTAGIAKANEELQDVAETTGVTNYNPPSQGGTRKELLAKYHKTKNVKDAEAARKAGATQKELQGVAEGNIKLFTDPDYFGAEVDDKGFDKLPIVNIPTKNLVGFEPDSKMQQPKAKRNVKKILAGLKSGADIPPILVRKHKGGYQVLDGHHRFWAHKVAKKDTISARVIDPKDIEEVGKQGVAEGSDDYFANKIAQKKAEQAAATAEFRKHGVTARKHGGDDANSWAVFINGRMMVNGLSSREVPYYKKEALKKAKETRGVAKGLNEMDKSAPQPGRDGKVSHSTYGSRDKKGSDYFKGKEAPGKAITAKQASKDALDILKKQGVAKEVIESSARSRISRMMQDKAMVKNPPKIPSHAERRAELETKEKESKKAE